ncbi:MAG TPA: hypothetical protein VIO32_04985 [Candidatus Baltobacteraceae bacterium]
MTFEDGFIANMPQIVGGGLIFLGIVFAARPQTALGAPNVRMESFSPIVQERFRAAVKRRSAYEHVGTTEIRTASALAIVVGILTVLRIIDAALAFPAFTVCGLPVLAAGFMRAHNQAPKRVAALSPRTASTMPVWQIGFFSLLACVPLAVPALHGSKYLDAAIFTTVSALVAIACSYLVARVPAMLSAEDVPVDRFLDERLRRLRTQQCAAFGALCVYSFMFLFKEQGQFHDDPSTLLLVLVQFASLFVVFTAGSTIRPPTSSELSRWFS